MLSQFNNFHKVTCFLTLIVTEWNLMRSLKGGRRKMGGGDVRRPDPSLFFALCSSSCALCFTSQYSVLNTNPSIPIHHFSNLSKNFINFPYAMYGRKLALLLIEVSHWKRLVKINLDPRINLFLILIVG